MAFTPAQKALCSSAVLPSGRLDSCKERFGLSPIRTLQFGDKTFIPLSALFLAVQSPMGLEPITRRYNQALCHLSYGDIILFHTETEL